MQDQERPGYGRGARWEGAIVVHSIYSQVTFSAESPYLPVLFDEADRAHVPFFVGGSTYYQVNPEDMTGLERVVARVLGRRTVIPVPLTDDEATDKKPQPVRKSSALSVGSQQPDDRTKPVMAGLNAKNQEAQNRKRTATDFPTGRRVLGESSQQVENAKRALSGSGSASTDDLADHARFVRESRQTDNKSDQWLYERDFPALVSKYLPGQGINVVNRMQRFLQDNAQVAALEAAFSDSEMMRRVLTLAFNRADIGESVGLDDLKPRNLDWEEAGPETLVPQPEVRSLISRNFPNISKPEYEALRKALGSINRRQLERMNNDADFMRATLEHLRRNPAHRF